MRIVLASDGHAHSRLAETLIGKLFKPANVQIHVVTAVAPPELLLAAMQPIYLPTDADASVRMWQELRNVGKGIAESAADRLRRAGFEVVPSVVEGNADDAILEYASTHAVGLIVIGSRGQNALQGFILGSVTRKVVANSPRSVLVVRHDPNKTAEETEARINQTEKLKLMVAADGTDGANSAIQWAEGQGPGTFASAVAVCAEPMGLVPFGIEPRSYGELFDVDRERVQRIAAAAAERLKACADTTESFNELGTSAHVLNEAATKFQSDLIVMGANRHGMLERFLLGSVSYEVATTAPCSVLIVRPAQSGQF